MPTYNIQAPDGKTYPVDGNDPNEAVQALDQFLSQQQPTQPQQSTQSPVLQGADQQPQQINSGGLVSSLKNFATGAVKDAINHGNMESQAASEAQNSLFNGNYLNHLYGGVNTFANGVLGGNGPMIEGQLEKIFSGADPVKVAQQKQQELDQYAQQYPASAQAGNTDSGHLIGALALALGTKLPGLATSAVKGVAPAATPMLKSIADKATMIEALRGGQDLSNLPPEANPMGWLSLIGSGANAQ